MKKILIFLSGLLFAIPAWSAQLLNTDASVLEILVPQYFTTEESQKSALITYKERLQANGGNGVSAEDITAVCAIGGADKAKCQSFINDMYRFSKFYSVCDGASLPSGSQGVCEKDFFNYIKVQTLSGVQLAKEYAKIKLNDNIICSAQIRQIGRAHV